MITVIANTRSPVATDGALPFAGVRLLAQCVAAALAGAHAAGCDNRVVEADPPVTEGEAILAALEHVAEARWGQRGTIMVRGQAAVKYRGEEPLSESTGSFLDKALEARGWRWSTEDPLVPTGNCIFPSGDCRLKNPTELHLTFSAWPWPGEEDYSEEEPEPLSERFRVEPVRGEEGYKVSVGWLSSYHSERRGRDQAVTGGEAVLVTRRADGLVVKIVGGWIS
ncbi:MAG: hypothetical protein OXL34_02865 [Gemmatimonadota bacterium]|nr:hypothetical protein [Gemmatimonadota bacterium]